MKTIIQMALPAPLSLVPLLFAAVTQWHTDECPVPGCVVLLTMDGMLVHDAPEQPRPAAPDLARTAKLAIK